MITAWIIGVLKTRTATVFGTITGIAITVGFVVALGAFMRISAAEMTARAASVVPIDWQVELVPGTPTDGILEAMHAAARIVRTATVGYAAINGFAATAGGTDQVTGPGKVIGVDPAYFADFPGNFRHLVGRLDGNLIAQQTAANLHVAPGDSVTIKRPGLPDATLRIDGVVDLPNTDSMFQAIGTPPNAAPQAPPDNILILPLKTWHTLFDPQADIRPDSARLQIHANLDHAALAADPQAAFLSVTRQGQNVEARAAGSALLANNLAAILGTAREDALYASVLFLFLGAPGAVVAILLTLAVAQSGAMRRRRDQSLLRLRGASTGILLYFAASEALALGIAGVIAGLLAGAFISRLLLANSIFVAGQLVWLALAAGAGIVLSIAAVLLPAWWNARIISITAARAPLARERESLATKLYLDVLLLGLSGVIFWKTAAQGYQIVLAPEGVAAISVDYWAFLAPLLFWLGMGLLAMRLTRLILARGRPFLIRAIRPTAGTLAPLVAAALARQPRRISAGVALTALAVAFAISTSIFNATYDAQSQVDAELTNGADVTVTGTNTAPAGQALDRLAALPGVVAAVPLQHRLAYVGTDLQDLYGIDPSSIGRATTMSNAYFAGDDASGTLAALQRTPDGILVSDETVSDFQLAFGDTINLRLQSASDHQYHAVPFRFIGIAREFPTAPHDSFLVANASYVSKATGNSAAEIVLMRVDGPLSGVRDAAVSLLSGMPGVTVRDLSETMKLIGSSLTAIDLRGLTRLELGYAIALAAAAAGLVLALGVLDRRRSFAIMTALGATPAQLFAFLRSEALVIGVGGLSLGALTGGIVAWMLVKLLTGVFDPPPDHLTIPWRYIALLAGATVAAIAIAAAVAGRRIEATAVTVLREAP